MTSTAAAGKGSCLFTGLLPGSYCLHTGFVNNLHVGNLVFRDNNADGKYTAGTDACVPGVQPDLVPIIVSSRG